MDLGGQDAGVYELVCVCVRTRAYAHVCVTVYMETHVRTHLAPPHYQCVALARARTHTHACTFPPGEHRATSCRTHPITTIWYTLL